MDPNQLNQQGNVAEDHLQRRQQQNQNINHRLEYSPILYQLHRLQY
jgi:hypothetical protein